MISSRENARLVVLSRANESPLIIRLTARLWCLSFVFVMVCVETGYADLTHQYTFNKGNAADSIGTANGVLQGNASIDPSGFLQLPGGNGNYLNLPAANIAISSYTDATFETWFTFRNTNAWQRVFDFGGDRTILPAGEQGYVYYTPVGGNGGGLGVYATFGQRTELPHGVLTTNQVYHMVMVIDDNANGGADTAAVYLNGQLQNSLSQTRSLSNVQNTFTYLGRSLAAGDPYLNGTIDEFRIYNHALTLSEIQSDFNAGPVPTVRLEVNTVTGSAAIVAVDTAPLNVDYYSIQSASGALSTAGWLSLDSQNLDAIGTGVGESWEIAPQSDSHELTELYLRGASNVVQGERLTLGHAFDTQLAGQGNNGDLQFRFAAQGSSNLRTGPVMYVTPGPLAGDYNDDNTVNAADYTIWRNTLGSTSDLRADGDNSGTIDRDDYVVWVWSFGNVGPGAGGSVPEPASLVLAFSILFVATFMRPSRRR